MEESNKQNNRREKRGEVEEYSPSLVLHVSKDIYKTTDDFMFKNLEQHESNSDENFEQQHRLNSIQQG